MNHTTDDAEDLDLVMPMYNLIEHSSNYFETARCLLFYAKNETINFNADFVNNNNFESFKYKTKSLGNTNADGSNEILKNATIDLNRQSIMFCLQLVLIIQILI